METEDVWGVVTQGDFHKGWETAVIKKSFEKGHNSFGWEGNDKIIISTRTTPLSPLLLAVLYKADQQTANKICNLLNGVA